MTNEPISPAADGNPTSPTRSAAAERMRRHRKRQRGGLLWLGIELRQSEIAALVQAGLLAEERRGDCEAVREALYQFLERELDPQS